MGVSLSVQRLSLPYTQPIAMTTFVSRVHETSLRVEPVKRTGRVEIKGNSEGKKTKKRVTTICTQLKKI